MFQTLLEGAIFDCVLMGYTSSPWLLSYPLPQLCSCLEPRFTLHQGKAVRILWARLEAGSESKLILGKISISTKVGFCGRGQPLKDLLYYMLDEEDDLGTLTEDQSIILGCIWWVICVYLLTFR